MKRARVPRYLQGVHYAWVTLSIAIAMRLVSSVERTASGVLVAYMVDPAGEFGWSRSIVGLALCPCAGSARACLARPPGGWGIGMASAAPWILGPCCLSPPPSSLAWSESHGSFSCPSAFS